MQQNRPFPKNGVFYYVGDQLVPEKNLAFDALYLLYYRYIGRFARFFLKRKTAGKAMGWYHKRPASRHLIKPFIEEYQIGMHDFVQPVAGYSSFNDFFIRKLQTNARPLPADKSIPVSPADAKLFVLPNVTERTHFFAKDLPFSLKRFLGSARLADFFAHGTLCMFRLAPYDYHRFHSPVDGIIEHLIRLPGTLESVNPISFLAGYQPLTSNERVLMILRSERHGLVAVMAVGALFVGSIHLTCKLGDKLQRGDEMGYFAFGASTVVVLFQAKMMIPHDVFVQHSLQGYETAIKMGEALTN